MNPESYREETTIKDKLSDIRKSLDPDKFPVSLRDLVDTMSELVDIIEIVDTGTTASYQDDISDKYSQPSVRSAIDIRASEIWDFDRNKESFIEEAAEVIQAVIHFRRGKCGKNILFGEMADLQIMLDRMKLIFGQDEFEDVLAQKYAALEQKMDRIESGEVVL